MLLYSKITSAPQIDVEIMPNTMECKLEFPFARVSLKFRFPPFLKGFNVKFTEK